MAAVGLVFPALLVVSVIHWSYWQKGFVVQQLHSFGWNINRIKIIGYAHSVHLSEIEVYPSYAVQYCFACC